MTKPPDPPVLDMSQALTASILINASVRRNLAILQQQPLWQLMHFVAGSKSGTACTYAIQSLGLHNKHGADLIQALRDLGQTCLDTADILCLENKEDNE